MKKIRSRRKSLLIGSIAMLCASAVALTTITYAWFSVSKDGVVDTLEFQATSVAGIQISTLDGGWGRTITADDLGLAYNTSGKLDPVSAINATTGGELKFYKANMSEDQTDVLAASKASSGSDGYFAFDIYVRTYGDVAQTLALDQTKTVVKDIKKDSEGVTTDSNDTYTSYAARVGIAVEGTAADKDTAKNLSNATSALIWEPQALKHTSDAIANYGISDNSAVTYNGLRSTGTNVAVTNGMITDAGITSPVTTAKFTQSATTINICALPVNTVTRLRVYIWLEGQDVDCAADIASGLISTALQFTAAQS